MSSVQHPLSPIPPLPIPPAIPAEASPAGGLPTLQELTAWRACLELPASDPLHVQARGKFAALAGATGGGDALPPAPPIGPPAGWGAPQFRPIPFTQFKDEVLKLYEPPLRAKATWKRMRTILELVGSLLGESATTADLTPALIQKLIESRPQGESTYTTNSYLVGLRAACNYGRSQGYLYLNPCDARKGRWLRLVKKVQKRHHSAEEVGRVLARMRLEADRKSGWAQWRAFRTLVAASLCAYCGLRRNEALYLRVEDIDLDRRIITLVPRGGNRLKTEAAAAPIPIPDHLGALLAEWLPRLAIPEGWSDGNAYPAADASKRKRPDPGWVVPNAYRTGPWIGGAPGHRPIDRMKILGKRAGVEGFSFQSLRHSWATAAESHWGLSELLVQRILRHTSTDTQKHYRHAEMSQISAAVRGLSFGHEAPRPAGVPIAPPPIAAPPAAPRRQLGAPQPPAAAKAAKPTKRAEPSGNPQERRKLDDEDVIELKRLRAAGWNYAALVARFGVAKSTIHAALTGATHSHIPDEVEGNPS